MFPNHIQYTLLRMSFGPPPPWVRRLLRDTGARLMVLDASGSSVLMSKVPYDAAMAAGYAGVSVVVSFWYDGNYVKVECPYDTRRVETTLVATDPGFEDALASRGKHALAGECFEVLNEFTAGRRSDTTAFIVNVVWALRLGRLANDEYNGLDVEVVSSRLSRAAMQHSPVPVGYGENSPGEALARDFLMRMNSESALELRKCSWCGEEERMLCEFQKCARCKLVVYCSKACQKRHWPTHKATCGK